MGRGIALAFAAAGHKVVLVDAKERPDDAAKELERAALDEIASDLSFLVSLAVINQSEADAALQRISFACRSQCAEALQRADLVFEGVPEVLEAKRECFAFLSEHVQPDCIIASTSSTIDPDSLAPLVAHPDRFLNAHWLNPAFLMPLVELSPALATSDNAIDQLRQILSLIGKVPVTCKGAGYIIPRIQALAMNEAARMVEEGVASAEDIDTAIRVGFGPRFSVLGLLEFIDWGGGDILHYASDYLGKQIDRDRYIAPQIIGENMKHRRRGLRDGAGFYDYRNIDVEAYRSQRLADFVSLLKVRDLMPKFKSQLP